MGKKSKEHRQIKIKKKQRKNVPPPPLRQFRTQTTNRMEVYNHVPIGAFLSEQVDPFILKIWPSDKKFTSLERIDFPVLQRCMELLLNREYTSDVRAFVAQMLLVTTQLHAYVLTLEETVLAQKIRCLVETAQKLQKKETKNQVVR